MDEARKWNRTFGYAKIVWKIENCFCLAYRNTWEITSPEFSIHGFLSIKWKFVLRVIKIGDCTTALIVLERLQSGDTSSVRAFWNLSFSFGNENINVSEKDWIFSSTGRLYSEIKNFRRIQEKLQTIPTDKFNVEALFLVTSTEDIAILEKSRHKGLRRLSHDLKTIKNLKYYHDVNVGMKKYTFKGHKAILTTGSELLKDFISGNGDREDIDSGWSDEKSAEKIFSYLYTGSLDYILRLPSILIDQAIQFFGVIELQKYYLKDELILRTKLQVREFYYKWEIPDILSHNNKEIFSPYFKDRDLDIKFRLRLQFGDIFAFTGNVTLFLEASSFLSQLQELFIIFEVFDIRDISVKRRRAVRWLLNGIGTLPLGDFITGEFLRTRSIASKGSLRILCTILIPTDCTASSILSYRKCSLPFINYEEHYKQFSDRIKNLLDSGDYSDLRVRCGNQLFYVHKCILSARSPVFAKAIRALGKSRKFSVDDIDVHILRIVLVYIYSGFLEYDNLRFVPKIYLAADRFVMMDLKSLCTDILVENLEVSNVFDRLFLAHAHCDIKLKYFSFKYIMQHRREIESDNWQRLVNENALYENFQRYESIYLRNNPEYRLGFQTV